jgi:hypothetical protein
MSYYTPHTPSRHEPATAQIVMPQTQWKQQQPCYPKEAAFPGLLADELTLAAIAP